MWRKKVGARMMELNPDYDSALEADDYYKYEVKK